MGEFIVELLVVVVADNAEAAERVGVATARAVARRQGILNAFVSDVRGEEGDAPEASA